MNKIEKRSLTPQEGLEIRAFEEDGKRFIEGYASVFNVESKLIYERGKIFHEIIERGAFDKVLADPDLNTIYNFNHDRNLISARTINGTLELSTDDKGLRFKAEVPDVTYANDLYTLIKRGDLFENSFAFLVDDEGQALTRNDEGVLLRRITEVKRLVDVSTVVFAAYEQTEVYARGIDEFVDKEKLEEDNLKTQKRDEVEKLRMKTKIKKIK